MYLKYIPVLPVMFVHSHLKCCVLIHMLFVLIDTLIKHCFYSFFEYQIGHLKTDSSAVFSLFGFL